MTKLDFTDYLVVGFIIVAGLYLFLHPSDLNYGVFCGLSAAFHITRTYDDKTKDCQ